jgi:hypothetical protein
LPRRRGLTRPEWSCAFNDTNGRYKHVDDHYSWVFVHEATRGTSAGLPTYNEGTGY